MTDPTDTGAGGGALPSRRAFLAGAVAAAGLALLDPRQLAAARSLAGSLPDGDLFRLGVASGDPTDSSVILWTRLLAPGAAALPAGDVAVDWVVAADESFNDIVASGTAPAVGALAHSVHVDVTGLAPGRWHWYRFSVDGRTSAVGRTRTFPGTGRANAPAQVRFALATCQNWSDGYYTAYAAMAAEDIELVVFVGDYIYETSVNRQPRPISLPESKDIPTYRARYELYKSDPNLQAAHQRAPWILTVDDHEVANNMIAGIGKNGQDAGNPAAIAKWLARRADAYQVWYEHQPVRLGAPGGADYRIHRVIDHSDLVRFYVLDGRQYRSAYPDNLSQGLDTPARFAEDRSMLGLEQEAWLDDELAHSGSQWNVLAQQTVMTAMPIPVGAATFYNFDQWDGYVAGRNRLLRSLLTHQVSNPMVLSGDIHLGAAGSIRLDYTDPDAPDIANEVVTPSITSRFDPTLLPLFQAGLKASKWVRYGNAVDHGYTLITVTPDSWTTEFRAVDVKQPSAAVRTVFVDVVAARAVPPTPPDLPTSTTTSTTEPGSTSSTTPDTSTTTPPTTSTPTTTEPWAPGVDPGSIVPPAPGGVSGSGYAPGATPVPGSPSYTG